VPRQRDAPVRQARRAAKVRAAPPGELAESARRAEAPREAPKARPRQAAREDATEQSARA